MVFLASSSVRMLWCFGSRCCTSTKAIPVSAGSSNGHDRCVRFLPWLRDPRLCGSSSLALTLRFLHHELPESLSKSISYRELYGVVTNATTPEQGASLNPFSSALRETQLARNFSPFVRLVLSSPRALAKAALNSLSCPQIPSRSRQEPGKKFSPKREEAP